MMTMRATTRPGPARTPFCGLIDPVLVNEPVPFPSAGSVSIEAARAAWLWIMRDLCPDLISAEGVEAGHFGAADLEQLLPEILKRAKAELDRLGSDQEAMRRFRAQFGREAALAELDVILRALRNRALIEKALVFGKAINTISDDAALGTALQSMPLKDPKLAGMLFHVALGQVANPTRPIVAVIKQTGASTEAAVVRGGFAPLIEAYLSHAQNQVYPLQLHGPFPDIDLVCLCLDRFHKLVRALTGYLEFSRGSQATQVLSAVTKLVSDRVEPRLKEVVTDLNQAMRRPREGADRLDNDQLLAALNGMYLLTTIRECRDSLALNAVFDQAWAQSGQALEIHIQRNLELIRQMPGDPVTGARLEAAIKMAEVRFNPEYAETLRRARVAAERRA